MNLSNLFDFETFTVFAYDILFQVFNYVIYTPFCNLRLKFSINHCRLFFGLFYLLLLVNKFWVILHVYEIEHFICNNLLVFKSLEFNRLIEAYTLSGNYIFRRTSASGSLIRTCWSKLSLIKNYIPRVIYSRNYAFWITRDYSM